MKDENDRNMSSQQPDEAILEVIMRAYDFEWEQKERIDNKLNNFMIIAATIATLYMGIGFFVLEKISFQHPFYIYLAIILIVGTGSFVLAVMASLIGYRPMKYSMSPKDPEKIIKKYKNLTKTHVIRTVAATLAEATNQNMEVNLRKTKLFKWVFGFLIFGIITIFVFTILLVSALSGMP